MLLIRKYEWTLLDNELEGLPSNDSTTQKGEYSNNGIGQSIYYYLLLYGSHRHLGKSDCTEGLIRKKGDASNVHYEPEIVQADHI
ncbi:MAG: hypothetical protein NVS4B12_15840 [Ktedonobacteraceae bacterium]